MPSPSPVVPSPSRLSVLVMTVLLVLAGARLARVLDDRAARRTAAVGIRA